MLALERHGVVGHEGGSRTAHEGDPVAVVLDDVRPDSTVRGVEELDSRQLVAPQREPLDRVELAIGEEQDPVVELLHGPVPDRHRGVTVPQDPGAQPDPVDRVAPEVDDDAVGPDDETVAGTGGQIIGHQGARREHLTAAHGRRRGRCGRCGRPA
jgi:hypothetical protein